MNCSLSDNREKYVISCDDIRIKCNVKISNVC